MNLNRSIIGTLQAMWQGHPGTNKQWTATCQPFGSPSEVGSAQPQAPLLGGVQAGQHLTKHTLPGPPCHHRVAHASKPTMAHSKTCPLVLLQAAPSISQQPGP